MNLKQIKNKETGEIYESILDASKKLGINYNTMKCRMRSKYSKFEYITDKEDLENWKFYTIDCNTPEDFINEWNKLKNNDK